MNFVSRVSLSVFWLALNLAVSVRAQNVPSSGVTITTAEGLPKPNPVAQPEPEQSGGIGRWLEVQSATLSFRYRFVENDNHQVTANQLQHQEALRARFKFDAAGRYSINALVASGPQFTLSWSNSGAGTGHSATNLYLKHLYLTAQPIKGIEFQYGSIPIVRGETTEITGYDNDGYLTGGRVTIKRPAELFFDEVSVTYAHLGDFNQPGVNKRFHRLKESNYHQFLVSKKLNDRVTVSADYTFYNGAETLRQGIKFKLPELRMVDNLRFENYQRVDVKQAFGFAFAGEKQITKRLKLTGGYAQVDPVVGALNADRLGPGKHLYAVTSFALTPELTLSTYLTHSVGDNSGKFTRTRGEVVVSYDLLKALRKSKHF